MYGWGAMVTLVTLVTLGNPYKEGELTKLDELAKGYGESIRKSVFVNFRRGSVLSN